MLVLEYITFGFIGLILTLTFVSVCVLLKKGCCKNDDEEIEDEFLYWRTII